MKLRYYQDEAVEKTFEYMFANKGKYPLIALPTGTGKSLVIAGAVKKALGLHTQCRVLVVTHVKELIQQNYEKLVDLWPQAPVGVYSAGLGRREMHAQVLYAGIDSLNGKGDRVGHRDIVLIDEAHRINMETETVYRKLFRTLYLRNPNVVFIGLTATPYRQKQGLLTNQPGLFHDIVVDYTSMEGFNKLLDDGFLCPLLPRPMETQFDITGVGSNCEDYIIKQLQEAVDKDDVTYRALQEAIQVGHDRESWMIFTTGIKHTENVSSMLDSLGIPSTFVHSKMNATERDERLRDYKAGHYRAIVNNNILTTGFDHPKLDMIVVLRPTKSISLWVQMLGRGTRIFPGKEDCLVLDFARNTEMLGPVNDPMIPDPKKKKKKKGAAPFRMCPDCSTYNHARATFCCNKECNHEFVYEERFDVEASTAELITREKRGKKNKPAELPIIEEFNVDRVVYHKGESWSRHKPPHLKVVYYTGLRQFATTVCIQHPYENYANKLARDWWRDHSGEEEVPTTVSEALELVDTLRIPKKVKVWINRAKPEVKGVEF